ncbi:MAG: DUF5666 domain-containing protein [Chloroflexi bacterium]|nr:DUF5666 domain-containing protein [Chloroflexota bacterium]MCI0580892.1 DUF5666 domain-containing protein [Chloroflexota bacterium]MCI0649740.1 DUF5666 domain-containing protein [Chloroflexota bacterium]MCI0725479.1 DUF5666 domain-containing protein [Chloroflexota bacterium]
MNERDFETILDQSLAWLQAGERLEACLAPYPEQADALRPLLATAGVVLDTPRPQARRAAVLAGRQRMLTALAAQKQEPAVSSGPLPRYAEQLWLTLRQQKEKIQMRVALRSVLTFLFVFFLGGSLALAASTSSLPGEPLYPVKRAWEGIHFFFMSDPEARQLYGEQLRIRRQEELQELIRLGRPTAITIEGRLEAMAAEWLEVDGFRILIGPATVWDDRPAVGQMVRVEVQIQSDGTLLARRIGFSPVALPLAVTLTPTPCNKGACGTETPLPTATPTEEQPTPTPSKSTATPTPCNLGFCGTITPTMTVSTTVTPTKTPLPEPTATICNLGVCFTVTPPATEPPPPSATPCPPLGCVTPVPTPTECNTGACVTDTPEPPTDTPPPPSATPCNPATCSTNVPSPTPEPSETPIPTPSGTPCNPLGCQTPVPTPTECNFGACFPPTESPTPPPPGDPTATPTECSPLGCNGGTW